MDKNKLFLLIMLIVINMVAHFMPLERASLASDNFVTLTRSKKVAISKIPYQMLKVSDRPISYAVAMLAAKLMGDSAGIGFILLISGSTLLLIAVFYLFNQLFDNTITAFIGSVIFCFLPNKLELYSSAMFFDTNTALALSVLSLLFFIYFIRTNKKAYLFVSLFTYCIVIFWYAAAFFMPIIIAAYSYLYNKKFTKYSLYFIVFSLVYAVYCYTNVFGFANSEIAGYGLSLSIMPKTPLVDLFHQYFGRYMARNLVYGIYKFFSIEHPWLLIIIFSDIAILTILFLYVRKQSLQKVDNRLLIFSIFLFIVFLIPFFLNQHRGMASRYLTLSSLGVTIFVIWLLGQVKRLWRSLLFTFIAITLIVCQGNAWSQVVASRINAALYQTMKEMKKEISAADNIVVDVKNLADNIPFTMVKSDYNVLDAYYGVHIFYPESIESMIQLVSEDSKKSVYTTIESPRINKEGLVEFKMPKREGYRSISKKTIILPPEKTVIIDFKAIYGKDFNNGLRQK